MEQVKSKKSKKAIVALSVAVLATAGLAVASAVALGINANNELGAGASITATCQPAGEGNDIVVGFSEPTYVAATQTFNVSAVELSNIDAACNGLAIKVVVADETGNPLGTVTNTVSGSTFTGTLPASVDSAVVGSVNVVIYDN